MKLTIVPFSSRFSNRLCLSALAALSTLIFPASTLHADPLQLQATLLQESEIPCNSFTLQGANFSFTSDITGYCSGPFFTSPGGLLSGFVEIDGSSPQPGHGPTTGPLHVPQNPGRVAMLNGDISVDDLVTIPLISNTEVELPATVTLTGTLSVCLLPAGAFRGDCDPNYLNFATVNVDISGIDVFTVACSAFAPPCTYRENFTGAAAPVPEPAETALIVFAGFAPLFLYGQGKNILRLRLYRGSGQSSSGTK